MAVSLRRSRLMDTFLVALLIVLLSAVHFAVLQSKRRQQFYNEGRKRAYLGLLVASWPLLGVGGLPLLGMWFMGRRTDSVHFSSATAKHMGAVMLTAGMVGIGCTLVAIAEAIWVIDIGFKRFHIVLLIGLISLCLLTWISFQVFWVVREASIVRRHLIANPNANVPQPGDFDFQSDSDRHPDSKENTFV